MPLLILPTLAVALRFLSRWTSRAGLWVRCLVCVGTGQGTTDRESSGMIIPLCWPAYVTLGAPSERKSRLTRSQFFCWGPSITNLVCQSHPDSFDRDLLLTWSIALHYGIGRHLEVLGPGNIHRWFKFLYAFEFLYTLAMASVKYSMYVPLESLAP